MWNHVKPHEPPTASSTVTTSSGGVFGCAPCAPSCGARRRRAARLAERPGQLSTWLQWRRWKMMLQSKWKSLLKKKRKMLVLLECVHLLIFGGGLAENPQKLTIEWKDTGWFGQFQNHNIPSLKCLKRIEPTCKIVAVKFNWIWQLRFMGHSDVSQGALSPGLNPLLGLPQNHQQVIHRVLSHVFFVHAPWCHYLDGSQCIDDEVVHFFPGRLCQGALQPKDLGKPDSKTPVKCRMVPPKIISCL